MRTLRGCFKYTRKINCNADQGSQSLVVASVLFATLQSFLPSNSSGRYVNIFLIALSKFCNDLLCSDLGETQSLIISTQIAADDGKVTTNDQSEQGAVLIGFSFPTVPAVSKNAILILNYNYFTLHYSL